MNIYSKKQRWKWFLLIGALIIIIISLWYTNILVNKIALEERRKVRMWADAIQKKAKLVRYTNDLFNKIKIEERKKVELWAKATKRLANQNLNMGDVSFIFEVIKNNQTVPVILIDEKNNVVTSRNLDSLEEKNQHYLEHQVEFMRSQHTPIEITISNNQKNYLYYKDSELFSELKIVLDDLIKSFLSEVVINSASVPVIFTDSSFTQVIAFGNIDSVKIKDTLFLKNTISSMKSQNPPLEVKLGEKENSYIFYQDSFLLVQLKYYPFIQFGIIGLFLIIAYTLFSTARRVEQNQVWVGMAKETAHQLGTPLSSLIAWMDYLKTKAGLEKEITDEIEKDISRLEIITERFSKIGSIPKLEKENILQVLNESINYIGSRTSEKVRFSVKSASGNSILVPINKHLFDWVIENITRNAVDSMTGMGGIDIEVIDQIQYIYIDITDTGKGIPKSKFKTVFEPGFTTKKRGWGLGLSLSKRIIENYHSGKIFIKSSEIDKGTTFRIVLNK